MDERWQKNLDDFLDELHKADAEFSEAILRDAALLPEPTKSAVERVMHSRAADRECLKSQIVARHAELTSVMVYQERLSGKLEELKASTPNLTQEQRAIFKFIDGETEDNSARMKRFRIPSPRSATN